MAVPVYERRESINPLPGARVQATGGAEAYGAGVGSSLSRLSEASMKLLNDFECRTACNNEPEKRCIGVQK
jgi:hypothetical protein